VKLPKATYGTKRIIHVVAQCHDCDWLDDDYRVAARRASDHARRCRHEVGVDQGVVYIVSGRPR